jgi:hypothetical protein
VKVLLDEDFPLPLHAALAHIILLGQRGMADSAIRERLVHETVVFLTNDTESRSCSRRPLTAEVAGVGWQTTTWSG